MAKKIQDGNQIVTNVDSNDNLTFSIKSSFIDSTPTVNSTNLVTSGGVKSALDINTTDIAAAVIRIANNETNISNNTDDIEGLEDAVSTNTTNISTNTTDIDTLETTVGTLSTNVNANTTKIGTLSNLTTTSKTNLVNAINELETDKLETSAVVNEASTDTDKTYSANYLNDKLVSVGTTAPTDGRRVWFAKSVNLLPYSDLSSYTENGITVTNNNDGTFTVNGTATADLSTAINTNFISMSGTWKLIGCPSGGSSSTYMLSAYVGYWGTSSPNIDIGEGTNITYTGNVKIRFYIKNGTTCNNLIFKPMITYDTSKSYESFEPYTKQGIYIDGELWISKE